MRATRVRPSPAYLDLRHACVASLAHERRCPVLFSEKLMHGTLPWTAPGRERRSLFYKYVRTDRGVLPIYSFAQAGR